MSGTFSPDNEDAQKAFDVLTKEGGYFFDMAKGNEFAITRKGGGFAFDGWFRISPPSVPIFNPAFDVTPARYVTAIITENGVAKPAEAADGTVDFTASLAKIASGCGSIHEL